MHRCPCVYENMAVPLANIAGSDVSPMPAIWLRPLMAVRSTTVTTRMLTMKKSWRGAGGGASPSVHDFKWS